MCDFGCKGDSCALRRCPGKVECDLCEPGSFMAGKGAVACDARSWRFRAAQHEDA